ncbi:MAG: sulfurtransferase [Myxococcales bacterium]|nr:sulfurtransferase [Myxococcales bacterium]
MRQLSVEDSQQWLAQPDSPQLVDCRQPGEWATCRLAGAVLIPLGELAERISELDPTRPVLVYCHHGVRSINGAMLLESAGLSADSMRGGIDAWSLRIDPSVPRY